MHLCRCAKYGRIHVGLLERFCKVGAYMRNSVGLCNGLGGCEFTTDNRYALDAVDIPDAVQVFFAECSGTSQYDFHEMFL